MGLLRFYLAISVVLFHFKITRASDSAWDIGRLFADPGLAVLGFFLLSGFYISLGLNRRYLGDGATRAFYESRILRLWPTYAVSLALLGLSGNLQETISTITHAPTVMSFLAVVSNSTLIGIDLLAHLSNANGHTVFSEYGIDPQHNGIGLIANFPAWTLSIEVLFYIAAPYVVHSARRSLAFLWVGIIYCAAITYVWPDLDDAYRVDLYYPYFMVYFGLGIMGYHLYNDRKRGQTTYSVPVYLASIAGAWACGLYLHAWFYIALTLLAGPIFDLTSRNKLDAYLGELSYPIYILHLPLALLLKSTRWLDTTGVTVLGCTLLLSIVVLHTVERPIDRYRKIRRETRARGLKVA